MTPNKRLVLVAAGAVLLTGCNTIPPQAAPGTSERTTSPSGVSVSPASTPESTSGIDLQSVIPPLPLANEDLGDFIVRCYAEFGIFAENLKTKYPEALITAALALSVPRQDPLAEGIAEEKCRTTAIDSGLAVDWSDPQQLRELYTELVLLMSCLDTNGYPTPDLPSEDGFVESRGDFDPYSSVAVSGTLRSAVEDCPSENFGIVDLSGVDLSG